MSEPKTIPELFIFMEGEFKTINQRLISLNDVEKKIDKHSIACTAVKEIRAHKDNHWKTITLAVSITGILIAGINFLLR